MPMWGERKDILDDPQLKLVGYQADFARPNRGFFLFNHMVDECGSTIVVEAELFTDLKSDPSFK